MVRHPLFHSLRDRLTRVFRAATLPSFRERIPESARRIGRGFILLAVAVWLGWVAEEGSHARALAGFERSHLPKPEIWRRILAERGWTPFAGASVLRTLPTQADLEGSVWWNSTQNWAVVIGDSAKEELLVFHSSDAEKKGPPRPEQWEPLGLGWTGLTALEERIGTRLGGAKKAIPRGHLGDPRSLRY